MLLLRSARVPRALLSDAFGTADAPSGEPTVLCDIRIEGETILSVTPASGTPPSPGEVDLAGEMVFPGFVDAHTHLDKTHTWFRAPNRSGTFQEALTILFQDKRNWTEDDLLFRGDFALRCAWAHGTRVLRTHVDTGLPWAETSHAAMALLRERWRGRVELQTVPLCAMESFAGPDGEAMADLAIRHGASALGGFALRSEGIAPHLDRLMAMAAERGVGLDLHIDETNDAGAECLRAVAEAVLRNRFAGPVACGHCCSLARQAGERQRSTLQLVREAGLAVISLPQCNLYLQDRRQTFPLTPSWRGLTLVRDLMEMGVPVACASDNVRDAFHAYGDYDMAAVYASAVRLAHLDGRLDVASTLVTRQAARIVGRPEFGHISPGAAASLVVFPARSFSELLSRSGRVRRRIDGEKIQAVQPPDFAELQARGL